MKEINVQPVSELEAEGKEGMCEIRFDCLVRMYDSGTKKPLERPLIPFTSKKEIPRKPQWFRAMYSLTLESIKHRSEHEIGSIIKTIFYRLEDHIRRYEENGTIIHTQDETY